MMHQERLLQSLAPVFGDTIIQPAPISPSVQDRFMAAWATAKRKVVHPGFHGSLDKNYTSILSHGLLIPGDGNELKVVNGAVFGRGVYIAQSHAAWLSFGFCSEPRMLVCAVIDMGCVKYHGSAMVVSNSNHVIPLFEAIGSGFRSRVSWVPMLLSRLAQAHVARKAGKPQQLGRPGENVVKQLVWDEYDEPPSRVSNKWL